MQTPSETTLRIRALNDYVRTRQHLLGMLLVEGDLVITRGVSANGQAFITKAMQAVRDFHDFDEGNDPYGEHDFGVFKIDGQTLFWKIDYYDAAHEHGSAHPEDAGKTRRVLTVLLAEEY